MTIDELEKRRDDALAIAQAMGIDTKGMSDE
jgi:hypothetical protein